ncbi:MAG: class B sortase [Clostridia bacterium]|nr:class B sortase [Clostridia bacterium]
MAEAKKPNVFVRILKFLFPWKGDSAGEVIRKLVFLISVIVLIVCGIYFANRFTQRKNYADTKDLSSLVSDSDAVDENGVQQKYKDLMSINKEFIGWLRIKDTGVDVPVVQTQDNETYLRKDFYGNYSVYGNPFLDYRNNLKSLFEKKTDVLKADKNTTIYGHNMLDNMVFAELLGYRDTAFYKEHPIIEFNTVYGESKWKIVSAFLVNSTDDLDNGYSLPYNFVTCYDANFTAYIQELQKRSYVNTGVDIKQSDVLLTLSTCDKSEIEEGRFVVVARMLRPGESEEIDSAAVSENTNIKFPQGYYDKKNLDNPYRDDAQWDPYKD